MPSHLNSHIAEIRTQDAARVAAWRSELLRSRGVCYAGMGPDEYRAMSDAEIVAAAKVERRRAAERERSPEGWFLRAALRIAKATDSEELLNCHSRGLASNANRAALIMADLGGEDADAARAALADFLGALTARAA